MDRNGLAMVLLLLVLIPSIFCANASSNSNHRKLATDEKDSLPGSSTVQSDNKTSDEKLASEPKQSDRNGPIEENSNKPGSETETHTSKDEDTKEPQKEVSQLGNNKKIVEERSKGTKPVDEKPVPVSRSEPKDEKKEDPKPVDELKRGESEAGKKLIDPNEKPGKKPGSEVDPEPPLRDKGAAKKKEEVGKDKKKEEKSDSGTVTSESCDTLRPSCMILTDFIGCVKSSDDGSKVVIIVQNKGDSNLMAVVSTENTAKGLSYEIPKKQSKLISVPVTSGKTSSIVLLGPGGKKCELPLHEQLSEENSLFRLPTYDKLVTPVNGAYFLIFSAVIFGGMFTCIKLSRRRRQGGGIPYQELEMGIPETVSTADVETAEGWDESWDDDDWENDRAAKSSATTRISANGLTSRAANKEGWDDNWDE